MARQTPEQKALQLAVGNEIKDLVLGGPQPKPEAAGDTAPEPDVAVDSSPRGTVISGVPMSSNKSLLGPVINDRYWLKAAVSGGHQSRPVYPREQTCNHRRPFFRQIRLLYPGKRT